MMMPAVDAGSLGQNLSCRASLVGAVTGSFECDATAVFVRGGPNNTTVTITGNTRDRNPEVNFSVRFALEPEPGKSYTWVDDVLSAELLPRKRPMPGIFFHQGADASSCAPACTASASSSTAAAEVKSGNVRGFKEG